MVNKVTYVRRLNDSECMVRSILSPLRWSCVMSSQLSASGDAGCVAQR